MYNIPFISSELMHWLKYIWCKLSMQQDLIFCCLFTSLFSRSVYQDDLFMNFIEHFLLLDFTASLSFDQLFFLVG